MIAAIILAAGASTRLGQPKQQLIFKEKTLLQHTVETALKAGCYPLVVVNSNKINAVQNNLQNQEHFINVINNEWETGMASSIKAGITAVLENLPCARAVICLVCDQPFVDSELLQELQVSYKTSDKKIIACAYKNTFGVPALFDQSFFPDLLNLNGDQGAKVLLSQYANQVETVQFPLGSIDIDTIEDYKKLVDSVTASSG